MTLELGTGSEGAQRYQQMLFRRHVDFSTQHALESAGVRSTVAVPPLSLPQSNGLRMGTVPQPPLADPRPYEGVGGGVLPTYSQQLQQQQQQQQQQAAPVPVPPQSQTVMMSQPNKTPPSAPPRQPVVRQPSKRDAGGF